MPDSRIEPATLLLGEALFRLTGLLALAAGCALSALPLSAPLLFAAASLSARELFFTTRRVGGRALCCGAGRWYWCREAACAEAETPRCEWLRAGGMRCAVLGILPLELWGEKGAYRPVLWLPLMEREQCRCVLLALRHPGVSTVSLAASDNPG